MLWSNKEEEDPLFAGVFDVKTGGSLPARSVRRAAFFDPETDELGSSDPVQAGEMHFGRCASVAAALQRRDEGVVNARAVRFEGMVGHRPQDISRMLVEMKRLYSLSLSGLRMDGSSIKTVLVGILPQIPLFAGGGEDGERGADLDLSRNCIESDQFVSLCKGLGSPLFGVSRLNLSETSIDDDCFPAIAKCFPAMQFLHLHGTPVHGCGGWIGSLVQRLPRLELLDVDDTSFGERGAVDVFENIRKRSVSGSLVPFDLWARGLPSPMTSEWNQLLDWCSLSKHEGRYFVKHDLLNGQRHVRSRQAVYEHRLVEVRLETSHAPSVVLSLRDVVCTKSVLQLARDVIDELTLLCIDFERENLASRDRSTADRRRQCRAAFSHLHRSGRLVGKEFVLGVVQLKRRNTRTGEVSLEWMDVSTRILGKPMSDVALCVEMEVEIRDRTPL